MEVLFDGDQGTVTEIKFADGSFVRKGRVLLEYTIADGSKKKVKSTDDGVVTFDPLIQRGTALSKDMLLGTLGPCKHAIVMKDLCATCGKELREKEGRAGQRIEGAEARVSMIHHVPELHVSKELAKNLGSKDQRHLLESKKLVLLVDLDQTIIHTANKIYDTEPDKASDVVTYKINSGMYTTKMRPYTKEFLENMSKLYEMHIVTMGQRQYAHKIAEIIDPDRILFRERILSRDELFSQQFKTGNLKALFPHGEQMIVIIDDRSDVWQHSEALIQVKPYRYFPDIGDINAPSGSKDSVLEDTEPEDRVLEHIEKVLINVHTNFYNYYERNQAIRDVKIAIAYLKKQVLRNTVLVLSGIVPRGQDFKSSQFYRLATQFGSRVDEKVTDETTHVVAARWGTDKVHQANRRKNVFIVHVNWLYACIEKWVKADEKEYKLEQTEIPPKSHIHMIAVDVNQETIHDMEHEVDEALSDEDDEKEENAGEEEKEDDPDADDPENINIPHRRPPELEDESTVDDEEPPYKRLKEDEDDENENPDSDEQPGEGSSVGEEDSDIGDDGNADDDDEDDDLAAAIERQISGEY